MLHAYSNLLTTYIASALILSTPSRRINYT
jgi:hypothetical protein